MAIRKKFWEEVPGRYPESPPSSRLTSEGVDYLLQHQKAPPNDIRADSADVGDGLRMVVHRDEADRPIKEFQNTGSRKVWLDKYRAQPSLQIRISTKAWPPGSVEANAYQERWETTQREIAAGQYTLPKF